MVVGGGFCYMVFLGASVSFSLLVRLAQAGPGIVLLTVTPLVSSATAFGGLGTQSLIFAMAFDLLLSLRPRERNAVVRVCVCRKWEFRGGTDDGPITHLDLVLVDEKGNSMYGEIPSAEVTRKGSLVDEGGLYAISRFSVRNTKSTYMPVPGNYMIEFTFHTSIKPVADNSLTIPQFVYHLTPFADLAQRAGVYSQFTDVIGVLVEVSEPKVVHLSGKAAPTLTRDIVLRDLSYFEIKVTLWGHRASAFVLDGICNPDEPKPIIVLLVGTLVKTYQGQNYLSGNAACRWYFNPQVPEANPFYSSLADQHMEIRRTLPAAAENRQPIAAQAHTATLGELEEMDPYDIRNTCYLTISSLLLKQRWWFPSRVKCNRSCLQEGSGYRCKGCSSTNYRFKYKLCFLATDGTAETEMVAFGDTGGLIVGKTVQQVMRSTRSSEEVPPDLAAIVSLSFTFALVLTDKSFEAPTKSYKVISILATHGRQAVIPRPLAGGVSSQPRLENLPTQNLDTIIEASDAEGSSETDAVINTRQQQPATHSSTKTPQTPPYMEHSAAVTAKTKTARVSSPKNTRPNTRRKLLLSADTSAKETTLTAPGTKKSKSQKSPASLHIQPALEEKSAIPDDDTLLVHATSGTKKLKAHKASATPHMESTSSQPEKSAMADAVDPPDAASDVETDLSNKDN